jgi:serine/threonine protein kinase
MPPDSSANYALLGRLADEFAERYRKGERPSLKEYIDRHPDLANEIREFFPAMAEIEQVKEDRGEAVANETPRGAPPFEKLGDYRIIAEIGRGGMGVVYEAEQVSLGRHVALKVLPRNLLADDRARRRFTREAKAAAKLHHTNIVPVFGVGEEDGLPYYVMQFIQGLGLDEVLNELKRLRGVGVATATFTRGESNGSRKDLTAARVAHSLLTGTYESAAEENRARDDGGAAQANEIANAATEAPQTPHQDGPTASGTGALRGPTLSDSFTVSSSSLVLPGQSRDGGKARKCRQTFWQSVATIGAQVAEALEYAHKQGIQHRDIKPSNLLLDTHGTVWVTDFGLAKAQDQQNLTHTGDILGTLRYMPPEALQGKGDGRSDVYSLGMTLYELAALKPAFEESDRIRLVVQITEKEPTPLRKMNPEVPRDLETIIQKATDKDPKRRYASAAEFSDDLQRFIADEPIKARRASLVEKLSRSVRRNKGVAAALFVVAFLLFVLAIGSTIAAALFKTQESEQRTLAARNERLAQEKGQLADDREEERLAADKARNEALIARQLAEERGATCSRISITPRCTWHSSHGAIIAACCTCASCSLTGFPGPSRQTVAAGSGSTLTPSPSRTCEP